MYTTAMAEGNIDVAATIDFLDYVNGIGNRQCVLNRDVYVGVFSTFMKVVRFTLAEELE